MLRRYRKHVRMRQHVSSGMQTSPCWHICMRCTAPLTSLQCVGSEPSAQQISATLQLLWTLELMLTLSHASAQICPGRDTQESWSTGGTTTCFTRNTGDIAQGAGW